MLMTRREFLRHSTAATALALAGGCDRAPTAPGPTASPPVPVLAAVYPLAALARQIGQQRVEVHCLVESGRRPSDITLDTDLRQRLGNSRLVLVSGPWDTWATELLSDTAKSDRVLSPQSMPSSLRPDLQAWQWLDPRVARELADKIRESLTVLAPRDEQVFRVNTEALLPEIDSVEKALEQTLTKRRNKSLLVVQPIWGAFCARFGLRQVAPVSNAEEMLTTEDYKAITTAARQHDVSTLHIDAATPVAVRQQIEQRTGLRLVLLDPLGTSAPEGRSTYAKIMRYNLQQLTT